MSRKSLPVTEADITKQIRDGLRLAGGRLYHFKKHQGLGSEKGIPDIIGCFKGLFFGIEVKKRPGLEPTDDQKKHLARINSAGGLAIVATSFDEVAEAFEARGFPLPVQLRF